MSYAMEAVEEVDQQERQVNGEGQIKIDSAVRTVRALLGMGTIFRAGIVTPKPGIRQWTTSCVGVVSVRREEHSC